MIDDAAPNRERGPVKYGERRRHASHPDQGDPQRWRRPDLHDRDHSPECRDDAEPAWIASSNIRREDEPDRDGHPQENGQRQDLQDAVDAGTSEYTNCLAIA